MLVLIVAKNSRLSKQWTFKMISTQFSLMIPESMQETTENCDYQGLFEETLIFQLNFNVALEHGTEKTILGEGIFSAAGDKCVVLIKTI